MFYTIYKTTNKANGKYYIGKHQTKDLNDGYLGSGKLLKAAIAKYGKDSFTKDILFVFDTEAEMNAKEAELVVVSEETYNLCPGGHGGFGYINEKLNLDYKGLSVKGNQAFKRKLENEAEFRNQSGKISTGLKTKYKSGWSNYPSKDKIDQMIAAAHTPEVNARRSATMKRKNLSGSRNPAHGKVWINNGSERKFVDKPVSLENGWVLGFKYLDMQ